MPNALVKPLAVALLAALVSIGASCDPKTGRRCTLGQAACTGRASGLTCGADGRYRPVSCDGRDGCRQRGAMVTCDQSVASSGEACSGAGRACALDARAALACEGGGFVTVETCRGPRGCGLVSGKIACDNDVAVEGDPCLVEGDWACTADRSAALRCTEKRMTAAGRCTGPKQCSVEHPMPGASTVACDNGESIGVTVP
jgi:hypothetical protein